MISVAYQRIEQYVVSKLGRAVRVDYLDAEGLKASGLAADPVMAKFGTDVVARSPALRRAQLVAPVIRGARILWVDDVPSNIDTESRLLTVLGAEVQRVRTTQDALRRLTEGRWDLLLSDIDRDGVKDAGLQMIAQLPRGYPPVVFYVGQVDESRSVPLGAFGITNNPESLLHLILDVLERHRV